MVGRIVIPARLASTRLPEKLLLAETGLTVLEHTYKACMRAKLPSDVTIAVDHERTYEIANGFGADVVMTDVNALSGTDRIAEVAKAMPDVDLFVNVQADEPEIEGASIDRVMQLLLDNPTASIATLATPIRSRENLYDPACVKVVCQHDGAAIYFSRSPIPHPRDGDQGLFEVDPPVFLQHIGIYAYRRDFLMNLHQLPASPIEQTEKLEQLRALQAGHRIMVGIVPSSHRGIDTRADYDAFKARWLEKTA